MTIKRKPAPDTPLSPREREILTLIAKGYTTEEIAEALGVARFTVMQHTKIVYVKIDVDSRAEAGVRACELGLHCTPAAAADPLPEALLCTLLLEAGHEPGTEIDRAVLHRFANLLAAQVRRAPR